MLFTVKKTFKPFSWENVKTLSQQELQEQASSLFNSDMDIKACFYLKRALKKNSGLYEDKYWMIEIMPIISIR